MPHVMLIPAPPPQTPGCAVTHTVGLLHNIPPSTTTRLLHTQLGCYTLPLPGCYTCTPSSGVCCFTAKGLLHMFTWHRCQPCSANTSPIERGVRQCPSTFCNSAHNCFVTALLLFWTPATMVDQLGKLQTCRTEEKLYFDAHCPLGNA